MKTSFQNVGIDCWFESEKKLSKERPCFCMCAEAEAIQILLDALLELIREEHGVKRTLSLHASDLAGSFSKIRLFRVLDADESTLVIRAQDDALHIGFTPDRVQFIMNALEAWRNGEEDFCLMPENSSDSYDLWFWRESMP